MVARMVVKIEPLVNEILDRLPKWVWTRTGVTFLDPAMGLGQFVKEIEHRLRKNGRSNSYINKHVYGCEEEFIYIIWAINKNQLKGNYFVGDLKKEWTMKFDVIVGNPPYKNKEETGGSSSLWRKFVEFSNNQTTTNGIFALITPQLSNTAKDLGKIFTNNQVTHVWRKDIKKKYFPNIGSEFVAYIVHKTPKFKKTIFIDEGEYEITSKPIPKDLKAVDIISKFVGDPFIIKSSKEYFHTSVADGINDNYLFSKKTNKLKYKLRRTTGETFLMYGCIEPEDYYLPKVTMTFSGYPGFTFHDKSDPIGTIKYMSGHILVNNKKEGEIVIKLLESKLYQFIIKQFLKGGMRGANTYSLPKLDLTKNWTDKEIYKHFNLTKEEIQLIEDTIKDE